MIFAPTWTIETVRLSRSETEPPFMAAGTLT